MNFLSFFPIVLFALATCAGNKASSDTNIIGVKLSVTAGAQTSNFFTQKGKSIEIYRYGSFEVYKGATDFEFNDNGKREFYPDVPYYFVVHEDSLSGTYYQRFPNKTKEITRMEKDSFVHYYGVPFESFDSIKVLSPDTSYQSGSLTVYEYKRKNIDSKIQPLTIQLYYSKDYANNILLRPFTQKNLRLNKMILTAHSWFNEKHNMNMPERQIIKSIEVISNPNIDSLKIITGLYRKNFKE